MFHITKLIKITIFLILLYSIYVYVKMPSLTEGFTNNVRETFRPTMRKIRSAVTTVTDKLTIKRENVKLKMGF
jgi:hypothetical protein